MLQRLTIRDFATVRELDVSFAAGMTVLTGETGAGKSILIDAIGLLLGDRGDAQWVREGRERAELVAEFDLAASPPARQWLEDADLADPDTPEQCILRRTIGADGRSRASINGSPVPVAALKALGEYLIDIHGQHEHQLLMRAEVQRQLLDDFGAHDELLEQTAAAARAWSRTRAELEALQADAGRPAAELELLRYQAEELAELDLDTQPVEDLEQEHRVLSHAGELLQRGGGLHEALGGDDGIGDQLARARQEAEALAALNAALAPVAQLLGEAGIQVREAADELQRQLDRVDVDAERLQQLERRLERLHTVARKHHVRLNELGELKLRLDTELRRADGAAEDLQRLGEELERLRTAWARAAERLTQARAEAARELERRAAETCAELGMPGARLQFQLETLDGIEPAPAGRDRVRIDFSANPGQPPKPLSRVASGGELSRVSLAIQVVASRDRSLPVMIFDEVDAGVGGAVAEIVGDKLRELSLGRQVLCVTHLPQVAAKAHQQLRIHKQLVDGETCSAVQVLDGSQREDEIARMLGGVKITEQTRAAAREMLAAQD